MLAIRIGYGRVMAEQTQSFIELNLIRSCVTQVNRFKSTGPANPSFQHHNRSFLAPSVFPLFDHQFCCIPFNPAQNGRLHNHFPKNTKKNKSFYPCTEHPNDDHNNAIIKLLKKIKDLFFVCYVSSSRSSTNNICIQTLFASIQLAKHRNRVQFLISITIDYIQAFPTAINNPYSRENGK